MKPSSLAKVARVGATAKRAREHAQRAEASLDAAVLAAVDDGWSQTRCAEAAQVSQARMSARVKRAKIRRDLAR